MKTSGFAVVCGRGVCVVMALLGAAGAAAGQSRVYEGFNYAQGARTPAQMNGGTGWSGAFAGSAIVDVEPASLTAPAALPTSGRSIRWGPSDTGVSLTRTFVSSFATSDEVWMSFVYQKDNFPSGFTLTLRGPGGAPGPGVFDAIDGFLIYRGDGTVLQPGLYANYNTPVFMLMRFGAASGGVRGLDLWVDPTPGALGLPTLSTTGPATEFASLSMSLRYETSFDEFRLDRNLAKVFVPSGGVGSLLVVGAVMGVRRRR